MTFETLKEEYKKSVKARIMDYRDYKALISELDEADTLDELLKVVELWAIPQNGEKTTERILLNRILAV